MSDRHLLIPMRALSPAGGVRIVCAIANATAARGIGVTIFAPSYAATPPATLRDGVDLTVVPARSGAGYAPALVRRLAAVSGICLATGYATPLLIATAAVLRRRRPQVLYLIQNYEPLSHIRFGRQPAVAKPLLHAAAWIGFRLPAYRIAVSRFVADRVGRSRVHEIVNPGIRAEFFDDVAVADRNSDEPVVGIFPTAGRAKGGRFALDAIASLQARGVRAKFLVYDGDYPCDDIPDAIARFSAYGTDVSVPEFYRACDIFVFPSLVEGFGLPPLEAMACGTAVVVSDSGGVRDFAADGENCLVVPPGDAAALARAIARLIAEPALRNRLRAAGRATAARFPEDAIAQAVAARIEQLADLG